MKVYVRFIALFPEFPREAIEADIPQDGTVYDLLKVICENWGIGDREPDDLRENLIVASGGHMLQREEMLHDGQDISIIGQIIGG